MKQSKDKKRKLAGYYGIYTIIFALMSIILFYGFWENRISFVWKDDGWTQHIRALQFYSDWLQGIVKNILFNYLNIFLFFGQVGDAYGEHSKENS